MKISNFPESQYTKFFSILNREIKILEYIFHFLAKTLFFVRKMRNKFRNFLASINNAFLTNRMHTSLLEISFHLTKNILFFPSFFYVFIFPIHFYDYLYECFNGSKVIVVHQILIESLQEFLFIDDIFPNNSVIIFFRIGNSIEFFATIMYIT